MRSAYLGRGPRTWTWGGRGRHVGRDVSTQDGQTEHGGREEAEQWRLGWLLTGEVLFLTAGAGRWPDYLQFLRMS